MDNRKFDWVIILRKGNSHAKGLQVCKKVYDDFYKVGYTYMYGDWYVDSQYVVKEWKLNSFTLLWNKLTAKYNPTLKDKVKKFFLHKDYPKEIDVRPDNNSLAIAQYDTGDDVHYEMIEYHGRTWVTELCFPVKPTFWAYVPKECVDKAELLNVKIKRYE